MNAQIHKSRFLQEKSANPANSAWVEASAGTGKTKVLTDRILRLLITGTPTANILCLTFTKSAAVEMEERLRERLISWSTMSDDDLSTDLKNLTNARVSPEHCSRGRQLYDQILQSETGPKFHTIHSFCESLLRSFPEEAGIDGSFRVLDDQESSTFLQSARNLVLQKIATGSNTTLRNAISCVSTYTHSEGFSDLLTFLISRKSRLEDLPLINNSQTTAHALRKILELHTDASHSELLDIACKSSSINKKGLHLAIEKLRSGTKTDKKKAKIIFDWLSAPQHQRPEKFEKYCEAFITRNQQPARRLVSSAVESADPEVRIVLEREQNRLVELLAILKRTQIVECTTALLELTHQVTKQFEHDKIFHNCLDYDDLITKARKALYSHGAPSWMLYRLDNSIDHILIDEAQDTSSEQWEIIKALVSEFFSGASSRSQHRTIFVVGDYKQSIYSFQQAEPEAFREMHQYFRSRAAAVSAPWSDISLQLSFRSALPILQAVDLVFPPNSSVYNRSDETLSGATNHCCYRTQALGLVELWPIIKPRGKCRQSEWKPPICVPGQQSARTQLAANVAIKIDALLSGEGSPKGIHFQPGDILVLVRRRSEFVTDLLREIQKRQIPVAGIDRLILTDNIAVMDLISLGRFLLNTDDDLSLAEVLKSPLCNFDDNDLFDIAYNRDGSLWASLCQSIHTQKQFERAKLLLDALLEKAMVSTPYELFADLLIAQGGTGVFVSRMGQEAIEPLEEFLNKAIQYETNHSPSLQGFINWIENSRLIVRRDAAQANENAVRILTVHGAKGLEAPVVFLPDTVQKSRPSLDIIWPSSENYPLWIPNSAIVDGLTQNLRLQKKKIDHEEYQRLLYVAMTRARDQLYICGWSETPDIPDDCWHSAVSQALRDEAEEVSETFPSHTQQDETVHVLRITNFAPTGTQNTTAPPSCNPPPPLPPWATQRLEHDNLVSFPLSHTPINLVSPSHINETRAEKLIAYLVDFLADIEVYDREAAADHFVTGFSQEVSLTLRQAIKHSALEIRMTPDLAFLFGTESLGCLPVSGKIKNRSQTSFVYSSIDRLILTDGVATIVNFQIGNRTHYDSPKIRDSVLEQIQINATLVKALYPEKHITSAILWTEKQQLESISHKVLGDWPS